MRPTRFQADLLLLLVALIWGTAFAAQRVAVHSAGVFLFNGLRFLIATIVLLPFAWRDLQQIHLSRSILYRVLLIGCILTSASALQQLGLRYTTAANAGFLTGLYVIILPVLLVLVWRQPVRPAVWPAAALAGIGLFLLSTNGEMSLNPGDGYELLGAFLWALHVILIGRFVEGLPVLILAIGQYFVSAVLGLLAGLLFENALIPGLSNAVWAILYVGIFSTGLGYTLQVFGQRTAPPADTAFILSLEAVFAAIFGWWLLSEQLSWLQILGAGIMFFAMILAQIERSPARTQI